MRRYKAAMRRRKNGSSRFASTEEQVHTDTMKVLIAQLALLTVATCGLIHHDTEDHKATSYQNIHIEHFHSVPTYIKKEDAHLLDHPISKGKTSSKVEVHHGGKHDHGYAIADTQSDLHAHGHEDFGGHDFGGHDYAAAIAASHGGGDEAGEGHGHEYALAAAGGGGGDEHGHGYALAAAGGGDEHGHGYAVGGGDEQGHEYAAAAAGDAHHASEEGHEYGHQALSLSHEELSQYHGLEHGYSGGDIGGHAAEAADASAGAEHASHGLGHYH